MEKMEKRKKVVANKMFSILKMIDDYINNLYGLLIKFK